jgi:hypothetical protein
LPSEFGSVSAEAARLIVVSREKLEGLVRTGQGGGPIEAEFSSVKERAYLNPANSPALVVCHDEGLGFQVI